jgi:ribosomal protein S12 methylthiotransferase
VAKPSVSFISLGCPKNLVDSEKMLGLLAEAGCAIVGEGGQADVLVINTCGFLSASRDEAMEMLREAAERKRSGEIGRIVVAGCLVQREGADLIQEVPEIDALIGVNDRQEIVDAVLDRGGPPDVAGPSAPPPSTTRKPRKPKAASEPRRAAAGLGRGPDGRMLVLGSFQPDRWTGANQSDRARLRLTPRHYAYLRLSEGCDQKCTFCTIPSIRGPMHSKPVAEIVAEACELVEDGAVELNLIGQDTTGYGRDIGYEPGLAGLLRKLDAIGGVDWIRLMYAYPSNFTDEMIEAVSECDRLVKYIDLPLQHINDGVLKGMHRQVTRKATEALLERLRLQIPGVSIRTTFIVGFPGETDAAFEELLAFVREFSFDALGVFPFSSEPGTPADRMKNRVPDDVIEARVEALMLAQRDIAFARAAARVGQRMRVLIDDYDHDGVYPSRHQGQAPEVDSIVLVEGGRHEPGDFVNVRCTRSRDYDLVATPISIPLPVLD